MVVNYQGKPFFIFPSLKSYSLVAFLILPDFRKKVLKDGKRRYERAIGLGDGFSRRSVVPIGFCYGYKYYCIIFYDTEEAKLVALAEDFIVKIKIERAEASGQVSLFTDNDSVGKRGRPVKKQLSDIIPVNQVKLDEIVETARLVGLTINKK